MGGAQLDTTRTLLLRENLFIDSLNFLNLTTPGQILGPRLCLLSKHASWIPNQAEESLVEGFRIIGLDVDCIFPGLQVVDQTMLDV
jgi:hypothetical protein